jgi:hypothetical protein
MKYFFTLFITLIVFIIPSTLTANTESDDSYYLFHLEYKNNTLAKDTDVPFSYDVIPGAYSKGELTGDFYGEIVSGQKKSLARFWFHTPQTFVPAKQKSVLSVSAPYFANADHVTFFRQNGTPLFTIDVSGSSFCDDNGACNSDRGENGRNCPHDCPLTEETPIKEETNPISIDQSTSTNVIDPIPPSPPQNGGGSISEPIITHSTSTESFTKNPVIMLTVGIFLILLSLLGWFVAKRRSTNTLI